MQSNSELRNSDSGLPLALPPNRTRNPRILNSKEVARVDLTSSPFRVLGEVWLGFQQVCHQKRFISSLSVLPLACARNLDHKAELFVLSPDRARNPRRQSSKEVASVDLSSSPFGGLAEVLLGFRWVCHSKLEDKCSKEVASVDLTSSPFGVLAEVWLGFRQIFLYIDSILLEAKRQRSLFSDEEGWAVEFSKLCEDDVFATFIHVPHLHCLVSRKLAVQDFLSSSLQLQPIPNVVRDIRESLLLHLSTLLGNA